MIAPIYYFLGATVVALGVVGALFVWFMDSRCYDLDGKRIPGPNSNLWGKNILNTLAAGRRKNQCSTLFYDVLMPATGDGDICGCKLFGVQILLLANPTLAKVVLGGHQMTFPKNTRYNRIKFALGNGLVTSSGELWKAHRNMMNPGFHAEQLKNMVPVFCQYTKAMLEEWRQRPTADKKSRSVRVDLTNDLCRLTMGVICKTGFGYDMPSAAEAAKSNGETLLQPDDVNVILREINFRIADITDWWYKLCTERTKKAAVSLERSIGLVDKLVQERINRREAMTSEDKATSETNDLLDLMLKARELSESSEESQDGKKVSFSSKDLRDHIFTFLGAGHETTASTLMWAFYEVALHPEVQRLCQEEIDRVLGGKCKESMTYENISELTYLSQVLKEVMRLHPAIPLIARSCTEEVTLGDYRVPAGTQFAVMLYSLHRHPDYWTNPNQFQPERFSPENSRNTLKHPFQFVPFSAGPRNCIGQRFATMESTTLFALILSNFSISILPEDLEKIVFEETITFQPRNFYAVLTPRQ